MYLLGLGEADVVTKEFASLSESLGFEPDKVMSLDRNMKLNFIEVVVISDEPIVRR